MIKLALFVLLLSPFASILPIAGVIVDSVRYDVAKDATFITLANVEHKDVTAVTLDAYMGDDHIERTREFAGGELFHPGTTVDLHIWGEKRPVVASVVAVAYSDGTTEAVTPAALKTIHELRVRTALAYEQASRILATAANGKAAAKQLEAAADAIASEVAPINPDTLEQPATPAPVASKAALRELARQAKQSNDLLTLSLEAADKAAEWREYARVTDPKPWDPNLGTQLDMR
jgi:hypothetical protein